MLNFVILRSMFRITDYIRFPTKYFPFTTKPYLSCILLELDIESLHLKSTSFQTECRFCWVCKGFGILDSDYKTNVMGTLNMLGLAKRIGAKFLLTSTSEVYGDPLEHPQKETYWGHVNPIGELLLTKLFSMICGFLLCIL